MNVPNFGEKTCDFQDHLKLCDVAIFPKVLCYCETLDVGEIELELIEFFLQIKSLVFIISEMSGEYSFSSKVGGF